VKSNFYASTSTKGNGKKTSESSPMPRLNEVFGISATVPQYTYVDRSGLDAQFKYFLGSDRHIVVHGGSKQGKTILRRKHLPEAESIVIPCAPDDTVESIFKRILANTGATGLKSISTNSSSEDSLGAEAGGQVGFGFAKLTSKIAAKTNSARSNVQVDEALGTGISVDVVINAIKRSRRRLVVEDFHYLVEPERKKLAYALKAFWDARVFVVIVGIWAEQNLITVYNNDLSGRIEEIDITWNERELREVVTKGENALNIRIAPLITEELLRDANANVGLLQRLLEGLCLESGVLETRAAAITIGGGPELDRCRLRVCEASDRRYFHFANVVGQGFKNPEKTKLKLYRQIVRVCIELATDDELTRGIDKVDMLAKVQYFEGDADATNLEKALVRIDRLQAERDIKPPVLSYGEVSRRLLLVDRELLFYRRHSRKPWPWTSGYTEPDEHDGVDLEA
jgi:DNA-binding Lrp family transcriptional regulator